MCACIHTTYINAFFWVYITALNLHIVIDFASINDDALHLQVTNADKKFFT